MITVYTVILNNYDNLRPPKVVNPACRYVCFTDRPRVCAPWEIQPFPQVFDSPARNARIPKCLPHLLLDCDASIYHDGAFRLNIDPEEAVRSILGPDDVAMFEHPCNHSIYDERDFYQRIHGFVPDEIREQVAKYEAAGLEITGRFWAGGMLIRRHNERAERLNETWMREYAHGSHNDQIALYYAVMKSGVSVATIKGQVIMDHRFPYHLHANSKCGDNPDFEADNAMWAARVDLIREICQ